MTPTPSNDLIVRYLASRLSGGDVEPVYSYLAASEQRQGIVAGLQASLNLEQIAGPPPDIEGSVAEFFARIDQEEVSAAPLPRARRFGVAAPKMFSRTRPVHRSPVALFGAVAGVVMLGFLAFGHYGRRPATQLAASESLGKSYTTGVGQQITLSLPDGSRVQLAPQSMLQIAPSFGTSARVVTVTGEAFFDVSQQAATPFMVRAGHTVTRVLGTKFGVLAAARKPVQVAVTAGKVSVTNESKNVLQQQVTLSAGMVGILTDSSAVVDPMANASDLTGWTTGRLVFHKVPTPDVLAALTRWYGFQFRVADSSIVRQDVTLGFSTESAEAALSTLERVLEVDLTADGNIITLHSRRGRARTPASPRHRWDTLAIPYTEVGR